MGGGGVMAAGGEGGRFTAAACLNGARMSSHAYSDG